MLFSIDWTLDLGALIAIVSVLVAAASVNATLVGVGRQISATLFSEVSSRYHELMRRLPVEISTERNASLSRYPSNEVKQILDGYAEFFRLLAGERHLHSLRLIERSVWVLWTASTRQPMRQRISKEAWQQIRPMFGYDPGFQRFVDTFEK